MSDEWFKENKDLNSVIELFIIIFPEAKSNNPVLEKIDESFDKAYKRCENIFTLNNVVEEHKFLGIEILHSKINWRQILDRKIHENSDEFLIYVAEFLGNFFGELFGVIEFGLCSSVHGAKLFKWLFGKVASLGLNIIYTNYSYFLGEVHRLLRESSSQRRRATEIIYNRVKKIMKKHEDTLEPIPNGISFFLWFPNH